MQIIPTARLDIVPCDPIAMQLLLRGRNELATRLRIVIPEAWPVSPEAIPVFAGLLEADPTQCGWLNYFAIHRENRTMIGDCGYFGKPEEGTVEIGYSVIPGFRRMGYAVEMVQALVERSFASGQVDRIIAHTLADNIPSMQVLERLGFQKGTSTVPSEEGPKVRWELLRDQPQS